MTSYIRDQAEGLPADDEDIRVRLEFYAAALSGADRPVAAKRHEI